MNREYKLFDFENEWEEAFGHPETFGVWFIWGNSGSGKSTFAIQLVKYLANFRKVVVNSLEEGFSHSVQQTLKRVNMEEAAKRIIFVEESMEDLSDRLSKKKSPDVVVIDSFQYTQMSYKQYQAFKKKHGRKLLIFVSHADGNLPSGRSARSVMYDATLKIWVEGYKAFSKGRYIGTTGEFIIWHEGAIKYWRQV